MRPDKAGVGINIQQRLKAVEMHRIFQHPVLSRVLPLQQLQDALVIADGRRDILFRHISIVTGGLAETAKPGRGHEVERQNFAVFHRHMSDKLMHRHQRRGDAVPLVDQLVRFLDARIGTVGRRLGWRAGKHRFPLHQYAIVGIGAKHVDQKGGAGTALADNENRLHNLFVFNFRMALIGVLDL